MKIIKIPKRHSLKLSPSPSTSPNRNIKKPKLLKLNTSPTKTTIPSLPKLTPHPQQLPQLTLYTNHKQLQIPNHTRKIFLPSLNKSTSSSTPHIHRKQTNQIKSSLFINTNNNNSSTHLKKQTTTTTLRKIHSTSLPGIDYITLKPKQNQDNYIIMKNVFNNKQFDIIGVFDGHGIYGHLVSAYIKNEIKNYFENPTIFPSTLNKDLFYKLTNDNFSFFHILNSFLQEQLSKSSGIQIDFSGSTCILVFIIYNNIIISNTGDSRAILISHSYKEQHYISKLSTDHKPDIPYEKERIEKMNGEVYKEDIDEPYRVWCKGKEYPGIAMSRSIGDAVAKEVGVCYEPEVYLRSINNDNMYIVVASDGLWDVLSNETVEQIVTPFYYKNDIKGACDELLNETLNKYTSYKIGRDDITIVIYFFPRKIIKYPYANNNNNNISLISHSSKTKLL